MSFGDAAASWDAVNRERVKEDTWGHLAPKRDSEYTIHAFVTGGVHACERTPVFVSLDTGRKLTSSPWLFDALQELADKLWNDDDHSGKLREFKGTMHNYRFKGQVRTVFECKTMTVGGYDWEAVDFKPRRD